MTLFCQWNHVILNTSPFDVYTVFYPLGIGANIFLVASGILVIGATVFLKRKQKKDDHGRAKIIILLNLLIDFQRENLLYR